MRPDILKEYSIYPIKIPTPFAVGDVFSYLIKDEKNVLVDTGQYTDDAFDCVRYYLGEQGLTIRDIDEIWLTHGHPDHYGQAARLADRAGATVFGHPLERSNFGGNDDADLFEAFFQKHSIPKGDIQNMIDQLDWLQQFQLAIEPEWIQEGVVLNSGDLSFKVVHTPGHAPGHVSYKSENGVIFGGDLLLAHISTNALINFDTETDQRNKSLLQYRKSLKWIRNQGGLVLPGHGEIIEDAASVADHHLNEHKKRYQKIKKLLGKESMSLLELSHRIFADAIKKGALFLVLSEVLGYLDWGIDEGSIEVDESKMEYRATN
ncbi:MBL fold metallo-hydrolase [Fodinibius sp.]|uniref:MBL fold metallo-hydrolase n=1 Tax=Fodinibius sp. TaxID=1872440 RepID=UPI002ACE1D72|nr:MBL fold metallo-hydrolase [Fodinibius sp.]MDZ7658173.1 MBL fold metallo-hydrolase [Fodinibius sp.]